MKENWVVEISQNGWEYTGYIYFEAIKAKKTSRNSIIIDDNFTITFDEEINEPYIKI